MAADSGSQTAIRPNCHDKNAENNVKTLALKIIPT
jgi:hypothetical protein